MTIDAYIAATRYGLGARPGDLAAIGSDARGWLKAQLPSGPAAAEVPGRGLPHSAALVREFNEARMAGKDARRELRKKSQEIYRKECGARTAHMIASETPFVERWVAFWSNHFTVSTARKEVIGVVGAFEREVIRPNAFGRFQDLLLASTRHPTMLVYLDQFKSVGPSSPASGRGRRGLNENLAREILELHTLGVDGGYEQDDVESFARILTGWGLGMRREAVSGHFTFTDAAHEPGRHALLGNTYSGRGLGDGEAALKDLAHHPSTARNVARRLATHFIADDPPASVVEQLAKAFRDGEGDLRYLARTLIEVDAAWKAPNTKLKTPQDLVVSTGRAISYDGVSDDLVASLDFLGQPPLSAPSPKGWSDRAEDWAGPEAILNRIEWCERVSEFQPIDDAGALARDVLGPVLSKRTRSAVDDNPGGRGLALLLASPEFQRR